MSAKQVDKRSREYRAGYAAGLLAGETKAFWISQALGLVETGRYSVYEARRSIHDRFGVNVHQLVLQLQNTHYRLRGGL